MRELIYLSDRKLQQFLPDPVPGWRRLGKLKAEVSVPLGSVSLESSAQDSQSANTAHFKRVVRQIEQSAKWFAIDNLGAGDWVFFEERINYWHFEHSRGPAIVLFLNLGQRHSHRTRLLLHGSPEHLVGSTQTQHQLRWGSAGPSPSDGSRFRDMLPVLRNVASNLDGHIKQQRQGTKNLAWDIEDLILALDNSNDASTAMWLAGYARVTLRVESSPRGNVDATFVAASPLYVEVLMPPDDEDEPL